MSFPLNQDTCNQRRGVTERKKSNRLQVNQQHLYGVSIKAERSSRSCTFITDLKISSGSHDSEQQGGPSEDPEWSPPDPSRDPVPVAAGQEESGEHLKG